IVERQNEDYCRVVREAERAFEEQLGARYHKGMGRDYIWKNFNIISRPVDKRENYVKRCVAIAGDSIQIKDQQIYINGKMGENPEMMQTSYLIHTKEYPISDNKLRQLKISSEDIQVYKAYHILQLTDEMVEQVKALPNVAQVERLTPQKGVGEPDIFPFDTAWHWNLDNFGPLWIPQKGVTIPLTKENLQLYGRCIEVYENNTLETKDDKVYLNGQVADNYTFKMDYYWMQGDNRHNSLDARYFGLVPEDHVVGTPLLIFMSKDKDAPLFNGGIRWNRLFSIPD
ncbi:MAG: S26 family signal peptidase, partial [Bacteroidales bacterium]|nr:S26 family signal peptidase [Bacteroidales bacterium]